MVKNNHLYLNTENTPGLIVLPGNIVPQFRKKGKLTPIVMSEKLMCCVRAIRLSNWKIFQDCES